MRFQRKNTAAGGQYSRHGEHYAPAMSKGSLRASALYSPPRSTQLWNSRRRGRPPQSVGVGSDNRKVEVNLRQPGSYPIGKWSAVFPKHNEQIRIAPRHSSSLREGSKEHGLFYIGVFRADPLRQFADRFSQLLLLKPKTCTEFNDSATTKEGMLPILLRKIFERASRLKTVRIACRNVKAIQRSSAVKNFTVLDGNPAANP